MPELLVCLYVVYLAGMGRVWLGWLLPDCDRSWMALSWSFTFGTIVWGYAQFLLNVFNLPVHGMWFYFWQVALVALPVISRHSAFDWVLTSYRRKPVPSAFLNWAPTFVGVTAMAVLGIALVTAALQALALPMHMWDSIVIYGFKAKILFQEQTFKTRAFMDPDVFHYSADYPLLIPYLESGFYRWLGHPDDRVVRLLFTAYWAAWLGVLYGALALRLRRGQALGLVAFVATLPLFSNIYMGQSSSGFADIPFALYWTAYLVCPPSLLPYLAVGCVFTKNEGIPLILIGWILRGRSRSALPALLLLAPWGWARYHLPHNAAHYLRPPDWALLGVRLKLIGSSLAGEILRLRNWGVFWFLSLLGLFWPAGPLRKESKVLLAAAGLQLACYTMVYLIYPQSLELLLPVTWPRLLIHMVGPLVVALGWRFEDNAG